MLRILGTVALLTIGDELPRLHGRTQAFCGKNLLLVLELPLSSRMTMPPGSYS
jgi:hypothetical protein